MKTIEPKSIIVIGDIMLDVYNIGSVKRVSPEAPVPVFLMSESYSRLGGAANVCANLVGAGQIVSLMSIVGDDEPGTELMEKLTEQGIDVSLIRKTTRKTTVKTRFVANNNQQLLRMDMEETDPIDDETVEAFIASFASVVNRFDAVILSDYLKGMLHPTLVQAIIRLAGERHIPVLVDVKDTDIHKYDNATLLKPNLKELMDMTGRIVDSDDDIVSAAEYLKNQCRCKYVLCTCGNRGMCLVGDDGGPLFVKAENRSVFDVSGAGDTSLAYLCVALANGFDMKESMELSNKAAGIQVGKLGTSPVYLSELGMSKLLGAMELSSFRRNHSDKRIVFTNGCFDILHIGHKRLLEKASKLGDILVVGLNSDSSVSRLKGPKRPINNEKDRAEMLSALSFVDYVAIFDEDTPYNLIRLIQPDTLVKGGDYSVEQVVGRDIVEANGGKVVLVDFVDGKSTTDIIKKVKS